MNWMIYGANGYTGKLIAREAKKRGLQPILAGRTEKPVKELAEELGLEWRQFDVESPNLKDVGLVLNCAGPFSKTAHPLVSAVIKQGKHYLDITGEISVFEDCFSRGPEAKQSGSVIIPGVGFDVVPTDCLAALLKAKLPDATELEMAMAGMAVVSPGTLKSMIEGFEKGGWVRRNGKLTPVPALSMTKNISFTKGTHLCSSIPWGDVSTAFHSTGIPNITFYATAPEWSKFIKPIVPVLQKIVALPLVQDTLKNLVTQFVKGPSEEHLASSQMQIWGKVMNANGKEVEGRMEVPEGYRFTVLSSLKAVERVSEGLVSGGVYTPSLAFGKDFIREFEEAKVHV